MKFCWFLLKSMPWLRGSVTWLIRNPQAFTFTIHGTPNLSVNLPQDDVQNGFINVRSCRGLRPRIRACRDHGRQQTPELTGQDKNLFERCHGHAMPA